LQKCVFGELCVTLLLRTEDRNATIDAYDKKQTKRKNDAAAVRDGTTDIAQTKRHATVQACTARNHDAVFLVAVIASVEGIQSATLSDPFFAPAVNAREAVERELARRRVARVHEVRARHEEAIRKGLIDATTLASFKLELEIARILGLKIGATGLTLEELFQDHAVYFGFCSLSEHRLREEESAFVTDSRRIPAFKNAVSGSPRTSFGALLKLKYSFSPTSLLFQQGSLKPSCKTSSTIERVDCGTT
jgi:hypothetical protein